MSQLHSFLRAPSAGEWLRATNLRVGECTKADPNRVELSLMCPQTFLNTDSQNVLSHSQSPSGTLTPSSGPPFSLASLPFGSKLVVLTLSIFLIYEPHKSGHFLPSYLISPPHSMEPASPDAVGEWKGKAPTAPGNIIWRMGKNSYSFKILCPHTLRHHWGGSR